MEQSVFEATDDVWNVEKLCTESLDNEHTVLYMLFSNMTAHSSENLTSYSVCAILLGKNGENDFGYVNDICVNEAEAYRMFSLISCGKVTPCTLCDVVYDMVSG